MIAVLMLHAALTSALLAAVAWLAERCLLLWRLPARHVWSAAMLASLVLSPAAAWMSRSGARLVPPIRVLPSGMVASSVAGAMRRLEVASAGGSTELVLAIAWVAASLVLAGAIFRAMARVRRERISWREATAAGQTVHIAERTGPAVVGLRHPRVVLPRWVLELDEPRVALIVRHEREHLQAGDHWLLALGLVALALEPWNVALWWQLARMRLAVEMDCDARVLRATADVRQYGQLLIAVCQRTAASFPMLAPALVERLSPLARRLSAMTAIRPRHRLVRFAVLASGSVALAIAACAIPVPTNGTPAGKNAGAQGSAAVASQPVAGAPKYFEFKIEKPALQAPGSVGPRYPDAERIAKIEGEVLTQFVVDTTGSVLPGSLKILKSSRQAFSDAVRDALPLMRFLPAEVKGHKVRQMLQQPFTFAIAK